MSDSPLLPAFAALGLPTPFLQALQGVGYETPSPIQAECIPLLLEGHDLIGQAQTGTGKTAAFALPLLAKVDTKSNATQLLVLAPTRELAIQVAEACQSYGKYLDNFHVLPIYGGASMTQQLKQLHRGAQVVVGTPGRVMDHMRRGTLKLDKLTGLVLDEADEMLRMGFIDDVEWVLANTPDSRQIALFSATMPKAIQQVAEQHLNEPKLVKIQTKTSTATTIRQLYWPASGMHKLDALTRILEVEDFDAAIIFVRTKTATTELADKLSARGYSCDALNGDVVQARREKIIEQLKNGKLDIVIATDVAARGLDVERISHVINYDIPYDTEAYVHRIGRTGRAGRSGTAILFVAPRENRLLQAIERATKQPIERLALPTSKDINEKRQQRFKQRILDAAAKGEDLSPLQPVIDNLLEEGMDTARLLLVLARLAQGTKDTPLPEKAGRNDNDDEKPSRYGDSDRPKRERRERFDRDERPERNERFERKERAPRPDARFPTADDFAEDKPRREKERSPRPKDDSDGGYEHKEKRSPRKHNDIDMESYRIEVGHEHGVKPGNIVGAIANEAGLDSEHIGHIDIFDTYSIIDLPEGMPKDLYKALKKVWVCSRQLDIQRLAEKPARSPRAPREAGEHTEKPTRRGVRDGENRKFESPRDPVRKTDRFEKSERPPRQDKSSIGDKPSRFAKAGDSAERPKAAKPRFVTDTPKPRKSTAKREVRNEPRPTLSRKPRRNED